MEKNRLIECYTDTNFADAWNAGNLDDASNILWRDGYVMYYAGFPVSWKSKLQPEIVLSTAETEYIALLEALRNVIPCMEVLKEMKPIFNLYPQKSKIVNRAQSTKIFKVVLLWS